MWPSRTHSYIQYPKSRLLHLGEAIGLTTKLWTDSCVEVLKTRSSNLWNFTSDIKHTPGHSEWSKSMIVERPQLWMNRMFNPSTLLQRPCQNLCKNILKSQSWESFLSRCLSRRSQHWEGSRKVVRVMESNKRLDGVKYQGWQLEQKRRVGGPSLCVHYLGIYC